MSLSPGDLVATTVEPEPALRRRLGPWAVSLSGIGIILGAGIYVLVGQAAGEAGNGGLAFYMAGDAFVAGLALLATGIALSEYIVRYERAQRVPA